ncbi:MAG: TolC family protein, partial [Gemmatimonadetes bacterium]|nr:TolC family protein [Gemmatimonadota bacterium]
PGADTLTVSLEDALAIAGGANPAVLRAEADLGLNGPETRSTWLGQVVPRVTVDVLQTGYRGNLQRQGFDNLGRPLENPEANWIYTSNTQQGLALNWNITGLSFLNARDRQSQTNRGRVLALEQAQAGVLTDVQRQFWDALEQRELLSVEEAVAEARLRDRETAERLFGLARNTRVDVLQAELAVEQQRSAIQQQRSAYEQALLSLRTTLGDTELPPIRPEASGLPIFDASTLNEEALVARALGENPGVRAQQAGVDGARIGVAEATEWKWPSLSLSYNWFQYRQTQETEALFDLGYDPDRVQSSFSVQVGLPFFNSYFQNKAGEAQARVQLQNQREGLKETRLQTEQEVRSQLIALRNQGETLRLAERSVVIAAEALRLAREEYRIGTRTFEQLQDAIEQEATSRRQVITSRYGFVDALVALEAAVGGAVRPGAGG